MQSSGTPGILLNLLVATTATTATLSCTNAGGLLQSFAALAMDKACEKHAYGCEFVIGTGDSFYGVCHQNYDNIDNGFHEESHNFNRVLLVLSSLRHVPSSAAVTAALD
jgi:hypothetical protein